MAPPRIVFHCTDQDLFDSFIRGLRRGVLTTPLRKEPSLQARYFRGYRLTKDRPDTAAIIKAYHKEINEKLNEKLLDYLCQNWILAHEAVTKAALAGVGVHDIDLRRKNDWLGQAHDALSQKGYVEAAREIVRALAFDYRLDDILTVISILCVDCDDQSGLRRAIEEEFQSVHDSPQALYSALVSQKSRLDEQLEELRGNREEATRTLEAALQKLSTELDKQQDKRKRIAKEFAEKEEAFRNAEERLQAARKDHEHATSAVQQAKAKRTTVDGAITRTRGKIADCKGEAAKRVGSLDERIRNVERDSIDVSKRLKEAKERIALHSAEDVSEAGAAGAGQVRPLDHAGRESNYTLQDVLDFVADANFVPSSVTIDICRLVLDRHVENDQAASDQLDASKNLEVMSLRHAQAALDGSPSWSSDSLCQYALYRSMCHDTVPNEARAEIVIGGLYHAGRIEDHNLTEQLLAQLVNLLNDGGGSAADSTDLGEALDQLEAHGTETTDLERLGAFQTKLATANARALRQLYDVMSPRTRIVAKRALVSKVPNIGVQDTDPTHEVLDLTVSYLETLVGPLLSGTISGFSQTASLDVDFRKKRQKLLAGTAKLHHLFSASTNARLTQFRDLFGAHLSEVLANDTLTALDKFRTMVFDFCVRDCRHPEWISCRYLLPIVISLAHATSKADMEIRKLRAEIIASLDKQQHPLSTVRSSVPLRIRIHNAGDAAAEELCVELEADRKEVTIRRRECRVHRIAPGESVWHDAAMDVRAAVTAVELSCLFRWQGAAGEEQLDEQTLKLTSQREVDWTKAGKNPYTLRSITSPDRLVGRDEDIETLRIGIEAAQSFCITGQKRVGKTSVARVLAEMFRENREFVSVYLPLGDCVTSSGVALVHSICGAILEELENVTDGELRVDLPTLEEFEADQARHNRAFRKGLERALEKRKVLCVIDDFDEIDERLYKGQGAAGLFLWLRSIIDRGYFSLVLVGSEKLPVVLKHQGERLNQVRRHSLDYFRDAAALRGLVVDPCREYLESEGAVDRIWTSSEGNPYYATQICASVYEDMYTRRDHYVAEADVQRCIDTICRESSVNNFQHLWTDGVFDRGPDTSRTQYLNAAILMACAAASKEDADSVARREVVGHGNLRKYDQAEVAFRLDNLVGRGVLRQLGDQIRLRVPLFRRWLVTGGEAGVRASFGEEDLETRLAVVQAGPSSREVVQVAADLMYGGLPVSEDRIRTWLQQFGMAKNQELAFLLLKRVKAKGYFDDARIQGSCKSVHRVLLEEFAGTEGFSRRMEKRRAKNVFVANLDQEGKSGADMLYRYRNANGWPQHLTGTAEDAVRFVEEQARKDRFCAVVFVDDFIGTGGSCIEGLRRFEALLEASGWRDAKVVVGVAAVAGFEDGVEAARQGLEGGCHVAVGTELGSEDRAFDPKSGIFQEEGDRTAAESLCRSIGMALEPKHPLGYGDCEALVTFSHRCPNNTLPVFYKSGTVYRGREWFPLFRR